MSHPESVRTPPWLTLAPDERVLLRARPSTNLVLAGVVGGFVAIVAGALPFMALGAAAAGRRATFGLIVLVLAAVAGTYALVRRREYALTSRRAALAVGLQSTAVRSVDLEDVRDVSLEQRRWQAWANVGTVRFVADGEDLAFDLVEDPHAVYERALERL